MDIDKLIKMATLEKNGAAKEAYRAIKAELLLNESSKSPKPAGKIVKTLHKLPVKYIMEGINSEHNIKIEVNELDLSIIRKLIKEREEQISMYDANSRKELADMYREQLKYYKELLPVEISKDKIVEALVGLYPNGFTQKQMGGIIKEIKSIYPTADGKLVASVVKEYIV